METHCSVFAGKQRTSSPLPDPFPLLLCRTSLQITVGGGRNGHMVGGINMDYQHPPLSPPSETTETEIGTQKTQKQKLEHRKPRNRIRNCQNMIYNIMVGSINMDYQRPPLSPPIETTETEIY